MSAPIPARIRDVLVSRLETIRQSAGFNTDLGLNVARGRVAYSRADLEFGPAVNLSTPGEELIDITGLQHRIGLQISIEAFSLYADDPDATADALLADIKDAVLSADEPRLTDDAGPLGQKLEYLSAATDLPDPGELIVQVTAQLRCRYFERYGAPSETY